jgi:predicted transcriptional regulator
MKLRDVSRILDAEVISGKDSLDTEVEMACGADLMSDVLAFIKHGSLLITGLTNPQVVRTAEMVDVKAICFVRDKTPGPDTIRLAQSKGIPLLITQLPMFEACGRLYNNGLPGCSEEK